jgi:hypothetical protein
MDWIWRKKVLSNVNIGQPDWARILSELNAALAKHLVNEIHHLFKILKIFLLLQSLHLKLINRYKSVCGGDLSRLPRNDNYFFYYIGYHIAGSKQYDMFPEWYFNLDFLDAKLKVAGPGDLLLDYKRYSPYFIDNLVSLVHCC